MALCAGPTLGAAFALVAEGRSLAAAMAVMGIYAPGYGLGRLAFGALMAMVGLARLTGLDHHIETVLVAAMADWLAAFTTTM